MTHILTLALRRLITTIPALVIILITLFLLLQLAPGDTVDALLAQIGGAESSVIDEMRHYYELDQSTSSRLLNYLWRLVHLDLGQSAIYNKPVSHMILERLPATLLLMISAMSLAFTCGTILGILSAQKVNRWPDTLISILGLIFYSTPSFWLALMGIVFFSIYLNWLPPSGFGSIEQSLTGFSAILDIAWYLILPTITLALVYLAIYLRIMRASLLEVSTLDFVKTAKAKGLSSRKILVNHVLRNAMLPMITLIGLQAGTMLGGSVVIETIFAIPGLGRLAYDSVVQRDLNTLLGVVFISAILVIFINFIVDMLYAKLDPRITGH
ncbi:ABC transporter permease [Gilliamella sp. W8126]|uniref:ABC transporter permease n=1 Tax=unclassified Gilliamella TaxID=2685620 RepID=UPI0018DC7014|nr:MULTISPECIES: ABC transporter permease [unclassified Gilliamella]MCT6867159.1 ABC transporter permease [Gilliamella apicola]MBI0006815.1 ABC transporter permease [Gilliamella sp. W8126]MBI0038286.1 ABC transporter permease [Gilliamella sp. B14384G10]MBI0040417.1 ABC transporter permease [Gilliamella sp. B14384G7]MBI0052256.1 ABC transporter permease [Gilliamella sp. B14384G13]